MNPLDLLRASGPLSDLDAHFARLVSRVAREPRPHLELAAAFASARLRDGEPCLRLEELAGAPLMADDGEFTGTTAPRLEEWLEELRDSEPAVGSPGDFRPLILDGTRLYLHKYFTYERSLRDAVLSRASMEFQVDEGRLRADLAALFPNAELDAWPRAAAFAAARGALCVLTGGPGTGKTTAAARIIALLLRRPGGADLRIRLAAPTGKAAKRMRESLWSSLRASTENGVPLAGDAALEAIPREASTLHNLLGARMDGASFRHNAGNPIPADVVIVDEASMIDLALMSRLFDALRPDTRLILIGDSDQLAPVEAGAPFADLCAGADNRFSKGFAETLRDVAGVSPASDNIAETPSPLSDRAIRFTATRRYEKGGAVGRLAMAVNRGDADEAIGILREGSPGIELRALPEPGALRDALREVVVEGYRPYIEAAGPNEALECFDRFRVLCATRVGPYGVTSVNMAAESALSGAGLIRPGEPWYENRPVLINRNDYNLRLNNGDIGIVRADGSAPGSPRGVFFPSAEGAARRLSPSRLPDHETAMAMTVHKSQGSEFDAAVLVLPERDSPLLTRRLLYTALTRARRGVLIFGSESIIRAALNRCPAQSSALGESLWGGR